MVTITEAVVEQAALGWKTAHGPDIAPDTSSAERDDYGQVILERRLRDVITQPVRAGEVRVAQVKRANGGNKLSGPCPTLESLVALGFEHREPQHGAEAVGYRFVLLDLVACHVMNLYARAVVLLSGVVETRRTLSVVESQIPNDLGSPSEAAAWVSYALKSHRSELEPLPDWFVEGERHWDLLPFVREQLAYEERQRAYQASPKCFIDRNFARPLRRNLLEQISWLDREAEMTCSFDGRVLSIDMCSRIYELVAQGGQLADHLPGCSILAVDPSHAV